VWFASLPPGKCQDITGTSTQVTRITFHVICNCSLMLAIEKAMKYFKKKYMKKIKNRIVNETEFNFLGVVLFTLPITVAARSKA
jgi:hypothetical protein